MLAGMWNERRLIQHHAESYVMSSSSVGFVVQWGVCRVSVAMLSGARAGKIAPLRIGFRLKLAASHTREEPLDVLV